jgi:hypothetical protein
LVVRAGRALARRAVLKAPKAFARGVRPLVRRVVLGAALARRVVRGSVLARRVVLGSALARRVVLVVR